MSAAALSALVFMTLIFAVPDCKPIGALNSTLTANSPGVNVTTSSSSSLTAGNSTDDDVIARRDVTIDRQRDSYGYHEDHGLSLIHI